MSVSQINRTFIARLAGKLSCHTRILTNELEDLVKELRAKPQSDAK
jgi:hypothetical protein